MKHFRDLVLSTKEPALHNVLWIEPKKDEDTGRYLLGEYVVKMYEDGWKVLFGSESGQSSNGLGFTVINPRTGLTQLYDVRDPDNPEKIYPITKAANVYLSNTVDVETAINNINIQLRNITSNVRKAVFAADDMINGWEASRAGKTFWVYDSNSALQSDGYFTGELFLRKYTTNSSYTKESLYLGDIVMAIDDEVSGMADTRMWYVNVLGSTSAQLLNVVDYKDLIQLRSSLSSTYIQDVQLDGISVIDEIDDAKVASIKDDVRPVYMINYANLETYYSGNNKKNKTFFFKINENNRGELVRYTSSLEPLTIELKKGDLLYNLDEHFDFAPEGLYVIVEEGNNPLTAKLIPSEGYVLEMISQELSDVSDNLKPIYIDFEIGAKDEEASLPTWEATTEYTTEEIASYFASGKSVYARLNSTPTDPLGTIPKILPLIRCGQGLTSFACSTLAYIFQVNAFWSVNSWTFVQYPVQKVLSYDSAPTESSTNLVNSGNIYTAIKTVSDSLDDYVLLNSTKFNQSTSYNHRMAATPKYHRAEWIEGNQDPNNPGVIPYVEGQPTPESRFNDMWNAIFNCHQTTLSADIYTPKLIIFDGVPACYSTSQNLSIPNGYQKSDTVSFTLKFFDGTDVITYLVEKDTDQDSHIILNVTKSTQAVTFQ